MTKILLKTAATVMLLTAIVITRPSLYAQNDSWTRKADFGGGVRNGAVGFSIGEKAYLGVGANNVELKDDFWEYDPKTNTWSQKANFPGGPRYYAIGLAVGKKGYVGMGYAAFNANKKIDFWQYDPKKNKWLRKADFRGNARVYAASFSIGNKAYIGTGTPNDGSPVTNDFWEYNAKNNKWRQRADFPGLTRYAASGFSIGKMGYIGIGVQATERVIFLRDVWEYNPATNNWRRRADYGGEGRRLATAFNVGSMGYVGLGSTLGINGGNLKTDFWEYNPFINSWTKKASYPGGTRQSSVGFAINRKGYVGTGSTMGSNTSRGDFWEYQPVVFQKNITRVTVPGTSNPWLAGMPNGTTSALGDFAPANSPVLVKVKLKPGSYIEVSNISGKVAHGPDPPFIGPEGCLSLNPCYFTNISHEVGAEHGKSSLTAPINSLVGVFLNNKIPVGPVPRALDFSSPSTRDYFKLSPKLKQVFFIGNGKTSSGVQQKIVIPAGATRLFLGTMDGIEWTGNSGAFSATVKVGKNRYWKRHKHVHYKSNVQIDSSFITEEKNRKGVIASFAVFVAPNPFQVNTIIQYKIPEDGHVIISLYDIYGRRVTTLVNSNKIRGIYSQAFNGAKLAKGTYFYQVEYVNKSMVHVKTGKIMLVK